MTGRPKKYGGKKALSEAIERYFNSISRTIYAKDEETGEIICGDDGREITVTQYIRPPSVSGLCLYLGIDRTTWFNYCDEKAHPEFREITAMTRGRLEAYLEEQLLMREKGVQGIIFNLQNNYGWKQRQEVELGEKTRKSAETSNMGVSEKIAVIASAQKMAAQFDEDGEPGNET